MSAWIVSKKHIDVLVASVKEHGEWSLSNDALGRLLWAENHASVAYRYPNSSDGHLPGPNGLRLSDILAYKYQAPSDELTSPATALNLAESYDYQSCEHPQWQDSGARQIIVSLIDTLKAQGADKTAEYEDAPWGFDL